jgi:hypothetical protein
LMQMAIVQSLTYAIKKPVSLGIGVYISSYMVAHIRVMSR